MQPLAIIEGFDVEEKVGLGLRPAVVDMVVDPFAFQAAEEAFHRRIVVAIAGAAHADHDSIVL